MCRRAAPHAPSFAVQPSNGDRNLIRRPSTAIPNRSHSDGLGHLGSPGRTRDRIVLGLAEVAISEAITLERGAAADSSTAAVFRRSRLFIGNRPCDVPGVPTDRALP